MKNGLVLTILLAAGIMVVVVVALAIGGLLTGKSRLRRGCGFRPREKKDKDTCSVCGSKKECEEEDESSTG